MRITSNLVTKFDGWDMARKKYITDIIYRNKCEKEVGTKVINSIRGKVFKFCYLRIQWVSSFLAWDLFLVIGVKYMNTFLGLIVFTKLGNVNQIQSFTVSKSLHF